MVTINLKTAEGNAFALLANAQRFGRQLHWTAEEIEELRQDMRSGDYKHLLKTFNKAFKFCVKLDGLAEILAEK